MKKTLQKILCLLLLVCMLSSVIIPASAAPENAEYLTTVAAGEKLTLIISFDKEFPGIVLYDPEENPISVDANNSAINLAIYDKWAAVEVITPTEGDWYIAVDKKSNTEVTWDRVVQTENIWIQYINVTPNTDGTIRVKFLAERGVQNDYYDYELYLGTAVSDGTTLLNSGSAITGEEKVLDLDMKEYTSYEQYVLTLSVTMEVDGDTLFDEYASAPFAFHNPDAPKAPDNIDIELNNETRELRLSWSEYKESRFDSYFMEIYAEGVEEPIFFDEFEEDDDFRSIFIENGYDQLTVNFYGREGHLLSWPLTRKVTLGDQSYVQIITHSPTASNQVQIKMNLPLSHELQVTVGETVSTFTSKGAENTVAVGIVNGNNLVRAEAVVGDVRYCVEKQIYKDGFPPMLSFYEPYDGKHVSAQALTLVGNAESAVSLYMNDTEIPMDEYGDFTVEITLQEGENIAEFVAVDEVGNRTVRTICIYGPTAQEVAAVEAESTQSKILNFLPLFIALALSIAAIVMVIILIRRREKLKKYSYTVWICILIVLVLLSAAGLTLSILRMNELDHIVTTMELSKLTDESLTEAAQLIEEHASAPERVMLWVWITVGAVVLLVLSILIRGWRKRRKNAPQAPQMMPPAAAQPTVVYRPTAVPQPPAMPQNPVKEMAKEVQEPPTTEDK